MSRELSIKQIHMNCSWEIKTFPQTYLSELETTSIIEKAYKEVKRIEDKFTVFKTSEFNLINDNAGISPVKVDQETWDLLQDAINFGDETDGFFNIAFSSTDKDYANYKLIELNSKTKEVYLPHKSMKISLGGIGKGYAVDQAYKLLEANGLVNFMVNGSGDVRVHSHNSARRPWKLGITNPFNTENTIGMVKLTNQAMATSGTYLKKEHIKSEEDMRPLSVTVITDKTQTADVWGTYLCSLSYKDALSALDSNNMMGIIITQDGKCLSSNSALSAQEKFKDSYHA